jgi:hypothetical protein
LAKDKARNHDLKAAVRHADAAAIARLVLDLCELTDENRTFAEARLAVGRDRLAPYKQRIDDALYPDVVSGKSIRIAAARKAITEYRNATGDPDGVLELMIYYVERGTAFTADHGDIDEEFYGSLASMYDRFLTALDKSGPARKESFRERAQRVVERASGIGWGFYDYLGDRFAEAYQQPD